MTMQELVAEIRARGCDASLELLVWAEPEGEGDEIMMEFFVDHVTPDPGDPLESVIERRLASYPDDTTVASQIDHYAAASDPMATMIETWEKAKAALDG